MRDEMLAAVVRRAMEHESFRRALIDEPRAERSREERKSTTTSKRSTTRKWSGAPIISSISYAIFVIALPGKHSAQATDRRFATGRFPKFPLSPIFR